MKHYTKLSFLLGVLIFLTISCNSLKNTQKTILSGNYDSAISQSLKYLRNNPNGKKANEFVKLLSEAYQKSNERDHERISFLLKEKNPEKLEEIFKLYGQLDERQKAIRPIIRKNIRHLFPMQDYSDKIIEVKNDLSSYLYNKSVETLKHGRSVTDFRKAYDDLHYVNKITPNYKDVKLKMKEAHFRGTDFVLVKVVNNSNKIIPKRLENELLDFDTYGINNFWTVYQNSYDKHIDYAYEMLLNITNIHVSPEQVRERELIKEQQIKDGYTYLEDDNGNLVKDSLGNAIKVDKLITVRCRLLEINQFKSARIGGDVIYNDLTTNQRIQKYPLSSEFVFDHRFATADGDRRALATSYLDMLKLSRIDFPSDEQMLYDVGKDLKNKLKAIIQRQKF